MLQSEEVNRTRRNRRLWLAAAAVWAAVIFAGSMVSSAGSPGGEITLKGVVGHVGEYALLAGLLRRAGLSFAVSVAVAVGYGVTDEFHQAFVPGRDASFMDLAFDVVGALLGAAVGGVRRGKS